MGATEATTWPASRFMTRTPVASRPCDEMSRTGMRTVVPPEEMTTTSSSRPTMKAGHDAALAGGELDAAHALAAAALAVEPVELRALAVARLGDDAGWLVSSRATSTRHHLVVDPELHAPHAGGGPAHGPHVGLV